MMSKAAGEISPSGEVEYQRIVREIACPRALRRDRWFPFSVFGPVLLRALWRFASIWRRDVIVGSTWPARPVQLGLALHVSLVGSGKDALGDEVGGAFLRLRSHGLAARFHRLRPGFSDATGR